NPTGTSPRRARQSRQRRGRRRGAEFEHHARRSRDDGSALMYRPAAYAIDDIALLHEVMRERRFATIAAILQGEVHFAYAPLVTDSGAGTLGAVRFHLARGNPMSE